ncbi:hypothetical protein [Nitrosarchaeum sp. AC2]|uniref:hypothetical protein n=1 Tax=Nitrosarchaeum sp. AC2 TaxID=2259673 RepID=UPI0015C99A79|nr:hypothetical protein [Nitrosarchaeum sp. AC2]QLH10691.1 hypothetical protein DSQ20_03750 [Nitrosarchaeum sp. AC2]
MIQKKRAPTEHASFRINTNTLDNLKKISKDQKLSLNTYVNQIFDSHVNWDVNASEIGWIVMLKSASTELIKHVDNQTIIKIAKDAAESGAKEIALSMRGKYGVNEWISILKERAKSSGFSIKEYNEKNNTKLVMFHEMGEQWSLFFKTYYETIFFDLGSKIKTEYTENSIIIELEV